MRVKKKSSKRITRITRTDALRILDLARKVLKQHGVPCRPYGKDYHGRRIYLRSGVDDQPFMNTLGVYALSRRRNILVAKMVGNAVVEIGCEEWAALAERELESILVLESLASL